MAKVPAGGAPFATTRPLRRGARDYALATGPTLKLAQDLVARLRKGGREPHPFALILLAMLDTQASIALILSEFAHRRRPKAHAGRLCSAVLLARPQIESCVVGLLLLVDHRRYFPLMNRGSWLAEARGALYDCRQFANTRQGQNIHQRLRAALLHNALHAGIDKNDAQKAVDDLSGKTLEALDSRLKERLPTVGAIAMPDSPFKDTQFEQLAPLLWWPWKRLSDSAHVSVNMLLSRAHLRGDRIEMASGSTRDGILRSVQRDSIIVSTVAILTLATALVVTRYPTDDKLFVRCASAWDQLLHGDPTARAIWEGWAKTALRAL